MSTSAERNQQVRPCAGFGTAQGQPGRCAGHRHAAADPGHRPQTAAREAAHRLVRACLQRPALLRSCTVHGQRADLGERASLPLSQLSDPRLIRAALARLRTRLDGSPATANTITRKRAVFHGALGYAVELGAGPGDPGPGRPDLAGAGRVLRLPVLRGTAPRRSRRATPRRPRPPGAQPRHDHPHRRLPAHRDRLDQHRHPVRAARPQAPPPTAPSASSPSRPSWPTCSADISPRTAARRTGGCSAAPAAACSASRPAARRPVPVAERHRRPRRDRRPGRDQRPRPARRLHPLRQRPGRHGQPADRRRPRRRRRRPTVVTVRESERLHEPPAPPRTLSAYLHRRGDASGSAVARFMV
jgi:hypothetical protein